MYDINCRKGYYTGKSSHSRNLCADSSSSNSSNIIDPVQPESINSSSFSSLGRQGQFFSLGRQEKSYSCSNVERFSVGSMHMSSM